MGDAGGVGGVERTGENGEGKGRFDPGRLPDHMKIIARVVDDHGDRSLPVAGSGWRPRRRPGGRA